MSEEDKNKVDEKIKEFKIEIPKQNKTDLERAKLYLELKKEFKRNIWWYSSRVAAAVPIVTLIVTGYILFNQNRIEQRRLDTETAQQFAAIVTDLEDEKMLTRLGAIFALENFIGKSEQYRSQVYLLLGAKLADETAKETSDKILLNQILETFRKVSAVRLANEDPSISLYLENCNFDSLNLNNFDFREATFMSSSFKDANLFNADLSGANLTRADLRGANLVEAHLAGANLKGVDLRRADLIGVNLSDIDLSKSNLMWANLMGANLTRADLSNANLGEAHLSVTVLKGANLYRTNLKGADLSQAKLGETYLEKTVLIGAHLNGADLKDARGLTAEQLIKTKGWENAELHISLRAEAEKLMKLKNERN